MLFKKIRLFFSPSLRREYQKFKINEIYKLMELERQQCLRESFLFRGLSTNADLSFSKESKIKQEKEVLIYESYFFEWKLNQMSLFCGTKLIKAVAMTRGEYNKYRGWELPADEQHLVNEAGYLVEYMDGGRANDSRHAGYISWSPADVFNNSYRENGALTFGDALMALKQGHKVCRSGWNGKGMWLTFVKPYSDAVHSNNTPCFSYRAFELPEGANGEPKKSPTLLPYIAMKTVGDELVPWLASQTDMLAEDWLILD